MESVNLETTLRPLRVAFLVDPIDRAKISEIIRLATCLWGGILCPIVPVSLKLPEIWKDQWTTSNPIEIANGYLRFFEPDVLVETDAGQLQKIGIPEAVHKDLDSRFRTFDTLIRNDKGAVNLSIGVEMAAVYDHLYNREHQFQRHDPVPLFDFSSGDSIGESFFETVYGIHPLWAEHTTHRAYSLLGTETVSPNFDTWHRIAWTRRYLTPFRLSLHGLSGFYPYSLQAERTFFIFNPCSGPDVIDFWNLRQFTPNVVPVNVHWLKESRATLETLLEDSLPPGVENERQSVVRTNIQFSRSTRKDKEEHDKFLPPLLREQAIYLDSYHAFWDPRYSDSDSPQIAEIEAKRTTNDLFVREGTVASVRVPVIAPDFDTEQSYVSHSWTNVVQKNFHAFNNTFATTKPSEVLDRRRRGVLGTQYSSREGDILLIASFESNSRRHLYLPTMDQTISYWLERHEIESMPSSAGRIAQQIITAIGGLPWIPSFVNEETIDLLNNMAVSRVEYAGGESHQYADRTATISQIRTQLGSGEEFNARLTSLVDAGALRLGTSVRCTHCDHKNWYGLDEVGITVKCERCLNDFQFPQGMPDSRIWAYRVAGAFATPNYAEGGYSVALTLSALRTAIGDISNEFTFTTGLILSRQDIKFEVDFIAFLQRSAFGRYTRDPVVVLGECKSKAKEAISERDVERLKQAVAWLPGVRLVVACMKPSFENEERERLDSLARWGWKQGDYSGTKSPLIVLSSKELFSDSIRRAWSEEGGRYAELANDLSSLDELAVATQELNLGMDREELLELAYE